MSETDDQPGRYSQIGRLGELLGAILERLVLCHDCGAIVGNTQIHDAWHEGNR